jgi:hypothetical protein
LFEKIPNPAAVPDALPRQVSAAGLGDAACNIVRLPNGDAAIHLIRYGYDPASDRVPELPAVNMEVALPAGFGKLTPVSPDGHFTAILESSDKGTYRLALRNVPLYGILRMSR